MRDKVSVIIPTYNMARWLPNCVDSIRVASKKCPSLTVEIIIVDDGSDLENRNLIDLLVASEGLQLVRQKNQGRLKARLAGIENAKHENILLIDSRVEIEPSALRWWSTLAPTNCDNFTSHVNYRPNQWFYGLYWNCVERLAWIAYWIKPRQKLIDAKNFEFYPKGTTCLISTKENLLNSYENTVSYSKDLRMANDDTLLLKKMAINGGIHISPGYQSWYTPRGNFKDFVKHTFHRGKVFADGHLFNLSIWGVVFGGGLLLFSYFTLTSPKVFNIKSLLVLLSVTAIVSTLARFSARHFICFLLLTPIFLSSYSAGILIGALAIVRNRGTRTAKT
jgi:glycosyltransferase involved in cell wall biosynthesis